MLKQIDVSELELGMFVHKFEGGWFDHPFWKAKFLIEDESRLAAIRQSKLRAVVIDTAKGKDLRPSAARPPAPAANPAPARPTSQPRLNSIKQRAAAQAPVVQAVSMEQEIEAAAAIAEKARERVAKTFLAARLGKAPDVRKVEPVVSDILSSVRRNPQAFSGLMRCKLRNEQIFHHAMSVSALMVALATRMKLPRAEVHHCGMAGLLLDIGVNYLPNIGDPPGGDYRALDERVWQQHVVLGFRALQNDGGLPQMVLDACLHHHERIDGGGYPDGRSGNWIPTIARMAAICDSFDFLIAPSDGTPGLDPAAAVAAMRAQTGAFDPEILDLFVETVGLYPVGSFVELNTGKLAMVIDEHRPDPTRPVVQAFFCRKQGERIVPQRIVLSQPGCLEYIIGSADMSGLDLPADEQLRELVFLSAYKNQSRPG